MLGTWLDLDAALIKVDEREEREQSSWLGFFSDLSEKFQDDL